LVQMGLVNKFDNVLPCQKNLLYYSILK
jgi:hypothetical protein